MKRRSFLKGATAVSMAPSAPVRAAATAARPVVSDYMLSVASFHAQIHGSATPAALGRALGIGPEAAKAVQRRLVREGLLSAPDAAGLARLNDPFAQVRRAPLKRLREWIGRIADAPAPEAEAETPEAGDAGA